MSFPKLVGGNGAVHNLPNLLDFFENGNEFTEADWKEACSLYSPAQLSMSGKRSRATLKGYVPWDKVQECFLWLLGFSWVDENAFLRRNTPANHPLFHGLYANEIIDCTGVEFTVKAAKTHPWSLPFAKYNMALVTVGYSQPPFDVLSDSMLLTDNIQVYRGQELRRWVSWHPKPYVDLLEVPGGQEVFDVPAGYTLNGVNLNGKITASKSLVRAQKSVRKIIWRDVPLEFVCNNYGFMPKIEGAIGKINRDVFFGTGDPSKFGDGNPHTWLLDDAGVVNDDVYADPLATHALANSTVQPYAGFSRRMDLYFIFRHFDPTNPVATSTERGWRLRPAWDGTWLPAKRAIDGGAVYPEDAEFMRLFTHWLDT